MATGGGELRPLQQFCEAIGCTLCNRAVPAAPKTLHCLHSFCEDCLVRYANGLPDDDRRRELPCPTCDVEQNPPLLGNGSEAVVQNLPTNLFFENFSRHVARETARHSDPSLIQCEDCEKAGRKANTFCTVCRISLCDKCVERHRDARRTERHELVDKRTNPARHGRWNCPQRATRKGGSGTLQRGSVPLLHRLQGYAVSDVQRHPRAGPQVNDCTGGVQRPEPRRQSRTAIRRDGPDGASLRHNG